jgi:TolB protein
MLAAAFGAGSGVTEGLAADVAGRPTSDRQAFADPSRDVPAHTEGRRNDIPRAAFQHNGVSLIDLRRSDGSLKIRIPLPGSLQNPAWSPDGRSIVFTRFRNGYNKGPADIFTFNLETNSLRPLLSDGSDNVSQPGSAWNPRTGNIAFSSDRDGHEEIWMVDTRSRERLQKVTSRPSRAAYEPSFAPDGRSLVFESREIGNDERGQITLVEMADKRYIDLTDPNDDCRQPNWSPNGDHIVYQKQVDGRWDIWLFDVKANQHRPMTQGLAGDKTDASFSPDGRFIIYSGTAAEDDESTGVIGDSLLALPLGGGRPIPLTLQPGYHGAPSWSPDGNSIVAETSIQSPDGTPGTELIITPVQKNVARGSFD